jgi:hypothetical protein
MTREELLKLAAEKGGTPQEIMAFAKEMEAFLKGAAPPPPPPAPAPTLFPMPPKPMKEPEYRQSKVGNRLVSNAPRARQHWSPEEIDLVKQALKENMPVAEISTMIGRPVNGVLKAIRMGKFK